ncbi:hypothetical protein FH972_021776 [Carpinus fangiana]|uniref:Alpha 1,4-glycosyltransferase domain-containing protein n=1 Tax=Carpinus fangiana TaxID=176857 RepID=A0A5N6KQ99_9ROSI|nr:hypothetical protein FH972_021776 [Carpinus fangiana]
MYHWAERLYHRLPLGRNILEHQVEAFDFTDTMDEIEGLNPPADSLRAGHDAIPSIIHFIWGLRDAELNFINYLAIRTAILNSGVDEIKLHSFKLNEDNEWLKRLKPNITLVPHCPEDLETKDARKSWHVAHLSDVLRLDILYKEGGIYLDMDAFVVRHFSSLLTNPKDVILGHEGGNRWGLCNAVILARKDAVFLKRWIDNYHNFSGKDWNYHSVILPKKISSEFPEEVCALSPTVFFWPTWTFEHVAYMHRPLSKSETLVVKDDLMRQSGALYANQIAYHAWSQMADRHYLAKLTPESMMHVDTRFNLMMRPIIMSSF